MLALIVSLMMASTSPHILTVPPEMLFVQKEIPEWTVEEMKSLATDIAKKHGLKVQKFLDVVNCESGWDRFAVGDHGTSFGLVQIHYPIKDWGMTIEQAYDPNIALETMARKWVAGEAYRWSCWRSLSS